MDTPQASLLAQAKGGDAKAFAALLNKKLQPKGITASASVKKNCLHIMLEAVGTPPKQPLVDFICKALETLAVDVWCAVKVYGRRIGEEIPDWVEEFKLGQELIQDFTVLAKQGDVKAIATLLNQKLQPTGVVVKVSIKDVFLQVMLEALEVPDQEQSLSFLKPEIQRLEVQNISRLRVYGKQSGEDFPDWQEEVELFMEKGELSNTQLYDGSLAPSSKITEEDLVTPATQEVDCVELSNRLFTELQTTCYQHLTHKVNSEDDKTIHQIVDDFVDGLETDLRLELDQFSKEFVNIAKTFDIQLERAKIQAIVSEITDSNFTRVRLAIRDLERVTREVMQTDFPHETDTLKSFFSGAAQEFTAQLCGMTMASKEAMIGSTIGGLVAPGIGAVIGGAIGGWFGGNKQQKALEQLLERYQNSRSKIFEEWESLLQLVYTEVSKYLYSVASVNILNYEIMGQAMDLYYQGNENIETDPEKSVDFYNKSIQLNPGLATAYNNKGYVLNQQEKFEEALPILTQALQIDRTLVVAHNNYGDALQGLDRNEEALAAYEESIKLEPNNYEAWWGKRTCLCSLQNYQDAIVVTHKLIELDSEIFLGWYAKAACYALLGENKLAIEALSKAVNIDSSASQDLAKTDSAFDHLRDDERFKELMESSVGASYALLKKHLKEKQWRQADQETAKVISWIIQKISNSTEVNQESLGFLPCTDLETIDSLWLEGSDGRLGFSIQKRIFQESNKDRDLFGGRTGWRVKDSAENWSWRSNANFDYNFKTMPEGHLPSSLWAGEDGWFENRRDRLITLFAKMDSCSIGDGES